MCVVTAFHRIQRTIFTPIPSQDTYCELARLVQQVMYRRELVPPSPDWPRFIPWRDELGDLNYLCFPLLILGTLNSIMGLVCAPIVSLILLLFYPLARLTQSQSCLDCTSDYRVDQPHQYYEIKLHIAGGYPIAYSSLDSLTDTLLAYLHAHGVTQQQVWVRDGFEYGETDGSGCATIPVSALTAADIAGLQQADEQAAQQMAVIQPEHMVDVEVGGMGWRAAGGGDHLLSVQPSDGHAYRLSDASPSP